jgi:hypothetical protein
MFCPRQKCNFKDFQNQRYISIFMSQRERERERERENKKERERKREYKSPGDFISKPPGLD